MCNKCCEHKLIYNTILLLAIISIITAFCTHIYRSVVDKPRSEEDPLVPPLHACSPSPPPLFPLPHTLHFFYLDLYQGYILVYVCREYLNHTFNTVTFDHPLYEYKVPRTHRD
jgi:hypothetical protein